MRWVIYSFFFSSYIIMYIYISIIVYFFFIIFIKYYIFFLIKSINYYIKVILYYCSVKKVNIRVFLFKKNKKIIIYRIFCDYMILLIEYIV